MQLVKNLDKIIISILPLVFCFCTNSDKIVGTVDDTDTGISVYLPDSTPAVDAVIKFIPSTRSQTTVLSKKLKTSSSAVAVVKTDSAGRFKIPALADSTYNVFMEKGDLKAFQGEVVITSQGNTIHDDTLRKTGSFSATVGLDPKDMHNVGSVAVQILGSDVQYLNPDNKGLFTFEDIAPGNYKLRLETSLPEYSPTYFTMTIKSNLDSIYPDTIFIKYNGIPSVHGLSAQFDTSNGIVKLSWDSTEYSNILDYVVFRDAEPTVTYSSTPYKATSATTLVDTIFDINKTPIDTQTLRFKYRVAIRNNSTIIGNTFGAVSVTATPYKSVLPQIDSIKITFDTLSGTANVSWISSPAIDSNYNYFVIKTTKGRTSSGIIAELQNADTLDTIASLSTGSLSDSLFNKKLSFSSHLTYEISYSISVFKKEWKLYGKETKSDSLIITPYTTRVPQITKLSTLFDTLHGVSYVNWDSIPVATGVSKYKVIRTVTRFLQPAKIDTLPTSANHALVDTIYPKLVTFDEVSPVNVSYAVLAFHSVWNIYGLENTITDTVFSYKAFPPNISAGLDQTVDISSDVLLVGRTISATFPVIKKEWKIGDSGWVTGGDSVQFRTSSEFTREIIPCIYKVTDALNNIISDTIIITKTPIFIALSENQFMQGMTMVRMVKSVQSEKECLRLSYIDNSKYGIWSTTDFQHFTSLCNNLPNNGYFFTFKQNYYIYNINQTNKCLQSSDAVTWSQINPIIDQDSLVLDTIYMSFQTSEDYIFFLCRKKMMVADTLTLQYVLFKTVDGINWDTISSNLPQEPYFSFFRAGDILCLVSDQNKYVSYDDGSTWQVDKLWDSDGDLFPDRLFYVSQSDSVTIVAYMDRPLNIGRLAVYKDKTWKILPNDLISGWAFGFGVALIGNRCIVVDGNMKPSCFKLY